MQCRNTACEVKYHSFFTSSTDNHMYSSDMTAAGFHRSIGWNDHAAHSRTKLRARESVLAGKLVVAKNKY